MIEGLNDILKADSSRSTKMDCVASVEEYINKSDWRIQANANTGYSSAGLVNNLAGKAIANFWLDKVYTKKEGDAHRNGDYHIHDLDCLQPYCFTSDTKIKTVEFGDISIKELLDKNVSSFAVMSYDGEREVKRTAHDLRCTRKDAELVEVEFEDGLVVRCTPDHKFLAVVPYTNPDTFEACLKMEWVEAKRLSGASVRKAYDCSLIKNGIIEIEEIEGVITECDYKNSFARVNSVKPLDHVEDVYCMTVDDTHCFALENGVIAHNCCGHDLQDLLQHGFNGVVSRVSSRPPKHLREALGQMANFIGILQSEWAGAQAFSSFDTLLAPYVFYDMMVEGIDERDVKKAILSFVYNLNVPSRWGQCVNSSYKCLRADGKWVSHNELQVGESIYVVDVETGELKLDTVTHVNVFDAPEKMHHYSNEQGFNFDVTPNHRVIYKTGSNPFSIKESAELVECGEVQIPLYEDEMATMFKVIACSVTEIDAKTDKVWCPTTNTGTFVCMTDEGYVFLTGNSPFSNVTIDMTVPNHIKNLAPLRGEEPYFVRNYREFCESETDTNNDGWNRLFEEARKRLNDYESDEETLLYSLTYQNFKKEMLIINKAYYEVLSEGDSEGQPFTFPIPTVNITDEFDWDDPDYEFLFENAAKYGNSYFNNFIGSQYIRDENGQLTIKDENAISKDDTRSMCCRLRLDKREIRKRGGGLFGSESRTGSIGVVTINMARLGYLFKGDIKGLYKRLERLMDMAHSTLTKKRAFVEEMYKRGLYPYTRRYVPSYDTYFSTIGVNGMNEMIRNFTNDEYDISDVRGQKMCEEILDFMNKKLGDYQEEGTAMYNLEATPAEGTNTRFAREDKYRYGSKETTYIICDKHGEVEVESGGEEYISCPLCVKEGEE